jgi:predicted transcriptional regulator
MGAKRISIGKVISRVMEEQKVSIASVAKKMGVSKVTVYRMLEKEHLPSERLVQFGELLRHDFFQYFEQHEGAAKQVKELAEQCRVLQGDNELLKKQVERLDTEVAHLRKQILLLEQLNRVLARGN